MISYHHRVISISNLDNKVNDNQHKTVKASQRVQYCLSGIQALREDLYYAGVTADFAVSFAVEWAARSVARGTKRGLEPAQGMRAVPGGAESLHRHDPSTVVCGRRFRARPPLSASTGVVENPRLSSGSPVRVHRIDIV